MLLDFINLASNNWRITALSVLFAIIICCKIYTEKVKDIYINQEIEKEGKLELNKESKVNKESKESKESTESIESHSFEFFSYESLSFKYLCSVFQKNCSSTNRIVQRCC